MKALLPLALTALLLNGCATVQYTPYIGVQKDWPTSDETYATVKDGVQIYEGLPPAPYEIIGKLRIISEIRAFYTQVGWAAKSRGAQAVILQDIQNHVAGSINTGGASFGYGTGNATAIKSGNVVNATGTSRGYVGTAPSVNVPTYNTAGVATLIRFKGAPPSLPVSPEAKTDPNLVPPNQRK